MSKRKGRPLKQRRVDYRELRPRLLIVCEGEKTEPNYFKRFKVSTHFVEIMGLGDNTLSLVKRALEQKEAGEYSDVWCVFDRDNFPPQNFNAAIELATQNGIDVAYSNEAFEIWYILHFHYVTTGLSRSRYQEILSECLGRKYTKNDPNIYDDLQERQYVAIQNAKRLLRSYGPDRNPECDNPCTTVHELVDFLVEKSK